MFHRHNGVPIPWSQLGFEDKVYEVACLAFVMTPFICIAISLALWFIVESGN